MQINEEQKNELKRLFSSFQECNDRIKDITAEKKAIVDRAAKTCECKKTLVTKLFKALEQLQEEGHTDIDEVAEMIEYMKA
jgi:predicted nucleic acid-binding OB-fold protein